MIVRVAVTGETKTPPLFDMLRVIGKERVLARLDDAAALLAESLDGEAGHPT
jgi:glutamyl/glutaminyl-tRNA synthetase